MRLKDNGSNLQGVTSGTEVAIKHLQHCIKEAKCEFEKYARIVTVNLVSCMKKNS